MTEIEEKLLDILFTSNNPLIRLQMGVGKVAS